MRRSSIREPEANLRLEASISGLADHVPEVSARSLLSRGQKGSFFVLGAALLTGLVVDPVATAIAVIGLLTLLYVGMVSYRFLLFTRSIGERGVVTVTDEEALAFPEELLPKYTVLIPAFHEPEVIQRLLDHVGRIEYPRDRLEILVLVEGDDHETVDAIGDADPGDHFELVFVPPAPPRTKPKALNYGLSMAKGDIVAVYDVEDIPDPLQLRRAAIGLLRADPSVACLQAKLSYHNPNQNLITRWFTIEYAMWFSFFLPGLASLGAPIPLGGTSNHFRRDALRKMGAWDPFNVTEDADLGIRLHREGFRVGILESWTEEEANSDFVNWVRQRSRWYKGYLQTLIVHTRAPRRFAKELGSRGVVQFGLFIGGTPILAIVNPIFWTMTVLWFFGHPDIIRELFPAPIYYTGLACWAFGNFLMIYLTVISCRMVRRGEFLWAALFIPIYWVMMSMAAAKALWQLITQPNHWEKTFHGLDPGPDRATTPV